MSPVLLALLACGGGVEVEVAPPPSTGALGFPHPAGYDAGPSHGPEAIAEAGSCGGCHRDGSSAPTCASCHETYPHVEGWLAGAEHGVGLTGDDGPEARATCAGCHSVEGLVAPSCASCHPSWPHPDGWELANQHGAWSRSRGSAEAACGSCHGRDLQGTPTADACGSCHATYPHPADVADPTVHGAADPTTCTPCHGALGEGGVTGVACSRCHANYPHPADMSVTHIATASRVGEATCLGCHDPGDGRFPIPAGCAIACHGKTP